MMLVFASIQISIAQSSPLWLRYPAVSPDGKTIVFSYQGDLYTVPTQGGAASVLTLHEGHDYQAIWSRDGKTIAFASNRYGNYDVFTIPAEGGIAKRLTFHSSNDHPSDFTHDDKNVIFSSSRLDIASNQQFPSGVLPELYKVPTVGGRVKQILSTPAIDARISSDGNTLIFHDSKGYEDPLRKHHTSSVARDLWAYDISEQKHTQLTNYIGEDRNPVFGTDGQTVYYLSEQSGSYNVYKMSLSTPNQSTALTSLANHPIRSLSIANNGLMCFSYHGELYTFREGEEPKKVAISIAVDQRYNPNKIMEVNGDVSEMRISPNGKEIAFIKRGEVFVSSVKEGTTKRITNTPEQERGLDFSPDGRSLLYASERNKSWKLYQSKIERDEEKYFFNSTIVKEEPVLEIEAETFQARYSPDGKEVAFLEERTALKVLNLKSKAIREIMPASKSYSYSDGDQHYEWSPDGKWFLVNYLQEEQWIDQAGLVSSSVEGKIINLKPTGYGAYTPQWMMDGKMIMWVSGRHGMKNHASWGGELDVYAMFIDAEAWDQYNMNEEEYDLWKEAKDELEKEEEESKKGSKKKKDEKDKELKEIEIDLDGREDRVSRLSVHSARLSAAIVSKDGQKLYYLARFEKGYNLWETDLRTKETKVLSKLGSDSGGELEMDKEGKNLFVLSGGSISKIELSTGESEGVNVNGEMVLNEALERAYLFEHVWRQAYKKFYRIDMQGVDWEMYKQAYEPFLPYINNNEDFAEMLSELLGELNASHTGAGYWSYDKGGDQTASLGLFYDESHSGDGLLIAAVMPKNPVLTKDSKIRQGVIIEKIDGVSITADTNYITMLNRKAEKYMLLSLYNPATKKRWDEAVKPISRGEEGQLRYERWVQNCDSIVEALSDGKIGYVHVRGMDDGSFRKVYETALGKHHDKEALIVDTRFNGGGWLHDDLATFLDGKEYIQMEPRGQKLGSEPQFKWRRPSAVVMGEANYSDAHMFPFTYHTLGIGKLIGMPVPGTGTAVWWEELQNGVVFGIPQVGMKTLEGEYLENNQLEPDIKVANEADVVVKGRDQQLEVAVQELMKGIK